MRSATQAKLASPLWARIWAFFTNASRSKPANSPPKPPCQNPRNIGTIAHQHRRALGIKHPIILGKIRNLCPVHNGAVQPRWLVRVMPANRTERPADKGKISQTIPQPHLPDLRFNINIIRLSSAATHPLSNTRIAPAQSRCNTPLRRDAGCGVPKARLGLSPPLGRIKQPLPPPYALTHPATNGASPNVRSHSARCNGKSARGGPEVFKLPEQYKFSLCKSPRSTPRDAKCCKLSSSCTSIQSKTR